jgi:chorismate mutase
MDALSDQIGRLWSALSSLQSIIPETATTSRLQELIASIDGVVGNINRTTSDIFALIERRRRAIDQVGALTRTTAGLLQDISAAADPKASPAAAADPAGEAAVRRLSLQRAVSELRADLGTATALLYQAAGFGTFDKLAQLRKMSRCWRAARTSTATGSAVSAIRCRRC